MNNYPSIRVVRSHNSTSSLRRGIRYEYPSETENLVYIRKPVRPISIQAPLPHLPPCKKKSKVKQLCKGIFNIFRSRHSNVGGEAEDESRRNRATPPNLIPYSSPSIYSILPPAECTSLLAFNPFGEEARESDDGEYIIYLPRISRAKLHNTFLDPLRRTNLDPVVVHPVCRQCTRCKSSNLHNHRSEAKNAAGDSCRLKTALSACSSVPEEQDLCWADKNSEVSLIGGELEEDSNSQFFFTIPATDEQPSSINVNRRKDAFKRHIKRVNLERIEKRHTQASKNKALLVKEKQYKLQTQLDIWRRRRLVGAMKQKLCTDPSIVIPSPETLDSRYIHIQWLGSTENMNNTVARYYDKQDNTVVALKIFGGRPFLSRVEGLDNKLMAIQEINSLRQLSHKNIVKMFGYFELQDKYHVVLEACESSLREEIDRNPSGMGTVPSKKILKQILQGLIVCHQVNCLHKDLSPENILLCKSGTVKIADFDRSVFLNESTLGNTCPTPGSYVYNSPEILAGDKKYGLPSDVWSLGVIFCEMLSGKPPWRGISAQSQLREIHTTVGPLMPKHASVAQVQTGDKPGKSYVHNHAHLQQLFTTVSKTCRSFIMKCLDVNPICRFTCGELMHHQFIKGK